MKTCTREGINPANVAHIFPKSKMSKGISPTLTQHVPFSPGFLFSAKLFPGLRGVPVLVSAGLWPGLCRAGQCRGGAGGAAGVPQGETGGNTWEKGKT